MASREGSARATAGHNRIPIAKARKPETARKRVRLHLKDILHPGALTSRLKRYAAEPAPDAANLTSIDERTANGGAQVPPDAKLLPKRIGQLPDDLGRECLIADAIGLGEVVFRHPEGSEQQIPDREGSGEIGIAALFERGVMPAMKHRRRQHVFERAERPVQIGV